MTRQEIAKAIDSLNWADIQSDDPCEGEAYIFLHEQLMKLDKEKALNVLWAVIEAQNLPDDFMGEDRTMHNFNNLIH